MGKKFREDLNWSMPTRNTTRKGSKESVVAWPPQLTELSKKPKPSVTVFSESKSIRTGKFVGTSATASTSPVESRRSAAGSGMSELEILFQKLKCRNRSRIFKVPTGENPFKSGIEKIRAQPDSRSSTLAGSSTTRAQEGMLRSQTSHRIPLLKEAVTLESTQVRKVTHSKSNQVADISEELERMRKSERQKTKSNEVNPGHEENGNGQQSSHSQPTAKSSSSSRRRKRDVAQPEAATVVQAGIDISKTTIVIVDTKKEKLYKLPRRRCSYCPKNFSESYYKTSHRHTHLDNESIKCEKCDKEFTSKAALKLHTENIHDHIKRFRCQFCNDTYYKKSDKNNHEVSLHTEIVYKCSNCMKRYRHRTSALNHSRSKHDGVNPHICTVCKKGYPFRSTLKNHMKSHKIDLGDNTGADLTNVPASEEKQESTQTSIVDKTKRKVRCSTCSKEYTPGYIKHHKHRVHSKLSVLEPEANIDLDLVQNVAGAGLAQKKVVPSSTNVRDVSCNPHQNKPGPSTRTVLVPEANVALSQSVNGASLAKEKISTSNQGKEKLPLSAPVRDFTSQPSKLTVTKSSAGVALSRNVAGPCLAQPTPLTPTKGKFTFSFHGLSSNQQSPGPSSLVRDFGATYKNQQNKPHPSSHSPLVPSPKALQSSPTSSTTSTDSDEADIVNCPICNVEFPVSFFAKHQRRAHGIRSTSNCRFERREIDELDEFETTEINPLSVEEAVYSDSSPEAESQTSRTCGTTRSTCGSTKTCGTTRTCGSKGTSKLDSFDYHRENLRRFKPGSGGQPFHQ